ncbi:MAG: glutaredoxin family protein [Deltaproteobacteria bacterium]|nr:glutaredoxin family protein [Deltaproteobacteria bacterium]
MLHRPWRRPTAPARRSPPPAGAPAGVVLYTAAGCPHCTRARSWLTEKEVPFVEKDVSSDPTAAPEIAALGKAQGIPESYLSSVPLLAIDGKLLVGFDPRQVEAALARR